jgi:cytosine/adenosine deaminase-related metal-dependent hydrolase
MLIETGRKFTLYQPIILYRKFTADRIFTGRELLPKNKVLVTTTTGIIEDIVNMEEAGDDILDLGGILSPGFINCHCHLELSHLKGIIPEKTGLVQFVQQVMTKRNLPGGVSSVPNDLQKYQEINQAVMEAAQNEMYENGTIAVGDICNTADSVVVKGNSKLHWHNFIEVSGFTDAGASDRMEKAQAIYHAFSSFLGHQPVTLSPHAPYSVSKTLFNIINELTPNQLITIHNQESTAENDLYISKDGNFLELYKNFRINTASFVPTGQSSMQSWLPYFNKRQSIISVHNTFTKKDDIDFANQKVPNDLRQVFYCVCINANKYIEGAIPPLNSLREKNTSIVLGTDSYASNWQLNLFEEIKTIQNETANNIPLHEVLGWATLNGAQALNMEDKLGSFEKGKQPGVVLIEQVENMVLTPKSFIRRIL